MRFTLTLEDADGNQICMTDPASTGIMTSEIEGLSPPAGTLSTAGYAGSDGSYLTNAYVDKRNIVISFQIRGASSTIEERRQNLYDIVQPGQYIKVYYKTTRRNVYTEGYVESVTVSNFSAETGGQISILCPDIYWHAVDDALPGVGVDNDGADISGAASATYPVIDAAYTVYGYKEASSIVIVDVETYVLKYKNGSSVDATLVGFYWSILGADENQVCVLFYRTNNAEAFSFPSGGWIEIDSATGAKYAKVYDSDGNHIVTLTQTTSGASLPVISSDNPYHKFKLVFSPGTITDDELALLIGTGALRLSFTTYANYLGV